MKRKNKIIEKIKRFLPLLLAVILSGSMILGLWLFSRSKGVNTVSASAESDNIYPYADGAIVSSGLLPNYYSQGNIVKNGITYSVSVTGSISVVGTATADSVYFIAYVDTPVELGIGEEYIFDFYRANSNVKVNCILQSTDYAVSYQNSASFVATRSYWYMYLVVRTGDTVDALVQPMLSLGSSVEPISSTYNLLKAPYNTSFSVNGITYSVGLDGSVILRGTASSDSVFYLNTVDDPIRLYYATFYSFACYLSNPNASIECLLTDTSNSQEFKANRLFVPSYPRWRLSLKIPKGAVFDGLKVQIMLNTGQIYSGYVPPYLDLVSKFESIHMDGVAHGIIKGYNQGYNQGYADITAETKEMYRIQAEQAVLEDKETFLEGIFAIVDAPLNVIRNAFNFEILGFNVADLLFFVLTLILFVFVIKKIKGG
jgi:hypothetical protein